VGAWTPTERDGAVTFEVIVQPRASRPGVGPLVGDRLRVGVAAPPVDGKANEAVVRTLAEALGVARSAVEIVRGETGRRKTVRVRGVAAAQVAALAAGAGK
jgi:uncharacterized protein (TIGR00251 family)